MIVIQVFIHVKPDMIEAFKALSLTNASNAVKEPGCARFDVIQQADDPTRFCFYEAYRSAEAQAYHRETAHYMNWRDNVNVMQAEDRYLIKYDNCFPSDNAWM